MISFLLLAKRFFRGLRGAWQEAPFRSASIVLLALLLSGTVFYSTVEGWGIVDSLYFSVVTLSTVGYGDLTPETTVGKLFTGFYIIVGIGLFVAVASAIARGYAAPKRSNGDSDDES